MWSVAFDHRSGSTDAELGQVCLERRGVVLGDLPDRTVLAPGGELELVVAHVRIGGEVADVGDVDHVVDSVALPPQRPLQRVGENIGPHVANVLIGVDSRSTRVQPNVGRVSRLEGRHLAV